MDEFDEFSDLYEEEKTDDYYERESKINIDVYNRFTSDLAKTYQGIPISEIKSCISICETTLIPWEHTLFELNFNNLASIGKNMTSELIIPDFIEEVHCGSDNIVNNIAKTKITTIVIPRSVMVIGPNAFAYFKNLAKIEINENSRLIFIGNHAFDGCEKLHKLDLSNCNDLDKETVSVNRLTDIVNIKIKI